MKVFTGIVSILLSWAVVVPAQSGDGFDLSHNVIAGGGGRSFGGQFTVEGTVGQNLAGTFSGGGGYGLHSGFWAPAALPSTAAASSISGRIRTAQGHGIRSASITLTNAATGEVFTTLSSTFGYYRFDEVMVGETYILTVRSRRYTFDSATRVINFLDELTNEEFIALPGR